MSQASDIRVNTYPGAMAATNAAPKWPFLILVRFRAVQLRNSLDQQLKNAPVRAFLVLALLVLIWVALYWVFETVLHQIDRYEMVALVARQQIFIHLFLASRSNNNSAYVENAGDGVKRVLQFCALDKLFPIF